MPKNELTVPRKYNQEKISKKDLALFKFYLNGKKLSERGVDHILKLWIKKAKEKVPLTDFYIYPRGDREMGSSRFIETAGEDNNFKELNEELYSYDDCQHAYDDFHSDDKYLTPTTKRYIDKKVVDLGVIFKEWFNEELPQSVPSYYENLYQSLKNINPFFQQNLFCINWEIFNEGIENEIPKKYESFSVDFYFFHKIQKTASVRAQPKGKLYNSFYCSWDDGILYYIKFCQHYLEKYAPNIDLPVPNQK